MHQEIEVQLFGVLREGVKCGPARRIRVEEPTLDEQVGDFGGIDVVDLEFRPGCCRLQRLSRRPSRRTQRRIGDVGLDQVVDPVDVDSLALADERPKREKERPEVLLVRFGLLD
jgi:hypothetical protein